MWVCVCVLPPPTHRYIYDTDLVFYYVWEKRENGPSAGQLCDGVDGGRRLELERGIRVRDKTTTPTTTKGGPGWKRTRNTKKKKKKTNPHIPLGQKSIKKKRNVVLSLSSSLLFFGSSAFCVLLLNNSPATEAGGGEVGWDARGKMSGKIIYSSSVSRRGGIEEEKGKLSQLHSSLMTAALTFFFFFFSKISFCVGSRNRALYNHRNFYISLSPPPLSLSIERPREMCVQSPLFAPFHRRTDTHFVPLFLLQQTLSQIFGGFHKMM